MPLALAVRGSELARMLLIVKKDIQTSSDLRKQNIAGRTRSYRCTRRWLSNWIVRSAIIGKVCKA